MDYDYIIVGSGFGGSVAALRLAEKGYRVCVIERGKRFRRASDFAETNWQLHKWLWLPNLFCTGIQELTFFRNALVLSGAGVGGGSLVYAAVLLEPPAPFYQDPQWRDLDDWRSVLAPHFKTARHMLGVTENPKLWPGDELVRDYARDIGREQHFNPTEVGIYFGDPDQLNADPYFDGRGPQRRGCDHSGRCMVGCKHGGKNSLDRNYLYLAEKLGATIIPETTVTLVEEIEDGYRLSMRSSHGWIRRSQTLTSTGVVFAAGAMGTNRLLLNCKRKGTLHRLSDALGKAVRTNSEILMGLQTKDPEQRYCDGIAITSSLFIDDHTHIEPVRYPEGSDAMFWLSGFLVDGGPTWRRALTFLSLCIRHPIEFLKNLIPFGWARKTMILLVMQTHDNRMEFVLRRNWLLPWKRRLASIRDTSTVPTHIPQANTAARALAKKMGGVAKSAVPEVLLNMPLTAHILGGCVIGKDASTGVVDKTCKVFGYDNMFITDGSIMPANLGVNPSLTITALAEHAMSTVPGKREGVTE
jgi:cholesterol oxidase